MRSPPSTEPLTLPAALPLSLQSSSASKRLIPEPETILRWVAGKGASGRRALFRTLHGTPKRHSVEKKVDGGFHFLTGPAGHPHRSLGRSRGRDVLVQSEQPHRGDEARFGFDRP